MLMSSPRAAQASRATTNSARPTPNTRNVRRRTTPVTRRAPSAATTTPSTRPVARAGTVTSGICTASELRLSTNTASSPDSLPMPNASIATSPSSAVATPNPTRRRAALRSATRSPEAGEG